MWGSLLNHFYIYILWPHLDFFVYFSRNFTSFWYYISYYFVFREYFVLPNQKVWKQVSLSNLEPSWWSLNSRSQIWSSTQLCSRPCSLLDLNSSLAWPCFPYMKHVQWNYTKHAHLSKLHACVIELHAYISDYVCL